MLVAKSVVINNCEVFRSDVTVAIIRICGFCDGKLGWVGNTGCAVGLGCRLNGGGSGKVRPPPMIWALEWIVSIKEGRGKGRGGSKRRESCVDVDRETFCV